MEVTRNVILDLLPLYVADEVSDDTRALVEAYLTEDPDLERLARRSAERLSEDAPVPLTKESQMESYDKAQKYIVMRTAIIATAIAVTLFCLVALLGALFMFGSTASVVG